MVIRLVSGWRGGFLYLSVWLCPPGPDLAALHPDWGSGRGIWDRRRRGGTVSSQRLLQSLQEGAEAEGREARQLQVGLRRAVLCMEAPPPHLPLSQDGRIPHPHPAPGCCVLLGRARGWGDRRGHPVGGVTGIDPRLSQQPVFQLCPD